MPGVVSPRPPVALEVRELRRSYGRLDALRDLTLDIPGGQCVALIGANGSGKSTTVRMIAFRMPDAAAVTAAMGATAPARAARGSAGRARAGAALGT